MNSFRDFDLNTAYQSHLFFNQGKDQGRKACQAGRKCIPAVDPDLDNLLSEAGDSFSEDVISGWHRGWAEVDLTKKENENECK